MPFYKEISFSNTTKVFLWKITEDYNELFRSVSLKDSSLFRLEKMKSDSHQRGFLAVRMLLQHIGYNDFDLEYDETGKPHLKIEDGASTSSATLERWCFDKLSNFRKMEDGKSRFDDRCQMMDDKNNSHTSAITHHPSPISSHISISHSGEFSAIALSEEKIGIDLEKMKDKVLKIAPRFMDISHLENLSPEEQISKATVVWGVKESIFKLKNQVGISFPDHIFEDEFLLCDNKCSAQLHFNNKIENFDIAFDFVEDYALVCAFEKK